MAYNPYYPAPYQPYGSYLPQNYQMMQPAQPQQPPVQQPMNQTTSGIIWISGESEAAMYPIAPNNAVALWAKDGKTIFLKQADATGRPTLTVYDLVERKESASGDSSAADSKLIDYATKEDLGRIVGVVKGIDDVINGMKSDIDAMKSDMYGIAGKKKPVKKEVVEDDA